MYKMVDKEEVKEKDVVAKPLSIDEAKKQRKVTLSEEEFEDKAMEKYEKDKFNKLYTDIVFDKVKQPDGSYKIMGKLPSNKIVFPDKTEQLDEIQIGRRYICWVYEPEDTEGKLSRVAFARIICENYENEIIVGKNLVYTMVWRDSNDKFHRDPENEKVREEYIIGKILLRKPQE